MDFYLHLVKKNKGLRFLSKHYTFIYLKSATFVRIGISGPNCLMYG